MANQLYFSIDTETGGLNPRSAKLLQVGLYAINLDTETNTIVNSFKYEWGIKPSSSPDKIAYPEAMEVNKLDLDTLEQNGLTLEEVSQQIIAAFNEVIKECSNVKKSQMFLLGQNLAFDIRFLTNNLTLEAVEYLEQFRQFELMCFSTAYFVNKGETPSSISLGKMTTELGITNEQAHTAYADAKATCEAMVEIRKRLTKI